MSPQLKRILLIIGLIATAAIIGIALYFAFQKSTVFYGGAPSGGGGPTATTTGQFPGAGERQPGAGVGGTGQGTGALPGAGVISQQPVTQEIYRPSPTTKLTSDFSAFPAADNNGGVRYHNAADGKFYRVGSDGAIKELSDQVFFDVQKVTWAPTQDKAVIEYPDNSKIIYNFDTRKQVTLPKHWTEFSFSPDSSEIAAKSIGIAPENRWLVTTKDDGSGTKLIEPLGNNADKVIVDWSPSRQAVAFSQTGQPLGVDRREVLFVGLNGENFKSAIVEGIDFQPHWSPTGKKLLYSVDSTRSDYKPELWIADSYGDEIGNNRQALQLNTWANKCTFSGDNVLFCAVPRDLPVGAGMSPEVAADNYDDLYKIDLVSGLKTKIPTGDKDYTMDNMSYDKSKNVIFFTDHHQNGILKVNL